jgi:hypothetical protein
MVFIGYEPGTKAYHTYDLVSKKVIVLRDVIFYEQTQWDRNKGAKQGEVGDIDDMFTVEVEYSMMVQGIPAEDVSVARSPQPVPLPPSPAPAVAEGGAGAVEEPDAPVLIRDEDLDADHDDDAPL